MRIDILPFFQTKRFSLKEGEGERTASSLVVTKQFSFFYEVRKELLVLLANWQTLMPQNLGFHLQSPLPPEGCLYFYRGNPSIVVKLIVTIDKLLKKGSLYKNSNLRTPASPAHKRFSLS